MCSLNLGLGWNISEQGYSLISQNNSVTDKNIILKNALNADLKEIGLAVLNKELNKNFISELVLQIQKIRNVAAPKANEESNAAPRMLKLTLTDGESFVQAIEISNISSISRERTPPGSKVLLKNVKTQNGFLCLNQNNIKLLGGNVPHLFEKWELAKSVQHHNRTVASADGPPAWVNFGIKVSNSGDETKVFDKSKAKEQVKENVDFENSRKDAIAEAATGAVRKVFGAGAKLANVSPRFDSNKLKNEGSKQPHKSKRENKTVKESIPQKPSDKVSLFDFLENKLQIVGASGDVKPIQQDELKTNSDNTHNYKHENKISKKEFNYDSENNFNNEYNNSHHLNTNKPFSYRGDNETNKRQFKNRDYINSYKNHSKNEYNDVSNDHYHVKKNIGTRNSNESVRNSYDKEAQISKRNNTTDNNSLKNNPVCRRNEDEKMHDSWHYRAPSLSNQVTIKSTNNIDNLAEHVVKMSIGGEFASRSLRQHLNLQGRKPNTSKNISEINDNNCASLNVGDECLAKYWEDNKFYPSKITASTETTFVVQFKGYGNIEEVLRCDCMPLEQEKDEKKKYRGSLEFRRNPKKFVST